MQTKLLNYLNNMQLENTILSEKIKEDHHYPLIFPKGITDALVAAGYFLKFLVTSLFDKSF